MIREPYEDGKRIISVDAAEEFVQVLDQVDNYRVEIEAPEEVIEAVGILDSAEELGIEPDDEGLPPEAYEKGRWNLGGRAPERKGDGLPSRPQCLHSFLWT